MQKTLQWKDLFVIIDDGSVTIEEYRRFYPQLVAQAHACPQGLGCLAIIPESAMSPPAPVRQYLEEILKRLPIRALTYVVEGKGFRAATVRAVLVSLGVCRNTPYPTRVVTNTREGIASLMPSASRTEDVSALCQIIRRAREHEAA